MNDLDNSGQISVEKKLSSTYNISPEIRDDIRESLLITLRNDKSILKDALKELFVEDKEFFRSLFQDTTNTESEITFVKVDKATARQEIQEYITKNPGCLISDLIENLKIDPEVILEVLKEFKQENLLRTESVE